MRIPRRLPVLVPAFATAVLLQAPAGADGGVVEINHTCATLTGCFDGDNPGYPVVITGAAGRRYALTSDLVLPSSSSVGISVRTSEVTLDLNGFKIIRSDCVGITGPCPIVSNLGSGIEALDPVLSLRVMNGTILGMGQFGIRTGGQAWIEGVRVTRNVIGISVGGASVVRNSTVFSNQNDGIIAGNASSIEGNSAVSNGCDGVEVGVGSLVLENVIRNNGCVGIRHNNGPIGYRGNVITNNRDGTVLEGSYDLGGNLCTWAGDLNPACP